MLCTLSSTTLDRLTWSLARLAKPTLILCTAEQMKLRWPDYVLGTTTGGWVGELGMAFAVASLACSVSASSLASLSAWVFSGSS